MIRIHVSVRWARRYGFGSAVLRLGTDVPVRSTDRPRGCCMYTDQSQFRQDRSEWMPPSPFDRFDLQEVA
jgi:hypothetical protein